MSAATWRDCVCAQTQELVIVYTPSRGGHLLAGQPRPAAHRVVRELCTDICNMFVLSIPLSPSLIAQMISYVGS